MLNVRKANQGETDHMGIQTTGWVLERDGQAIVYDQSYPFILRCLKVCEQELLEKRIERSTKKAPVKGLIGAI